MLRGVMRGTIVALLLTACTTAMHFRVIDKGAYGAEASKPSVTVTKGRNESVIRLELGSGPTGGWAIEPLEGSGDPSPAPGKTKIRARPARRALGARPTGGWRIAPREVGGAPSLATVKTKIVAPPAGGIVTMALTAPYAVIAIDADVKAVRWVDENGNLIAESK